MTDFILGLAGVIQKEINSLGTVAQNSANANTVGYKAVQEFASLAGIDNGKAGPDMLARLQSEKSVQLKDGALRQTGRSTDLALSGTGWFVVDTPRGPRLTRDGRFQVNAAGYLVDARGWPVVGENGALQVGNDGFTVATNGQLTRNGEALGKLVVVAPQGASAVQPEADSLYAPTGPVEAAANFTVHQGVLEQSNANLSADMVRLMETSRHIESVQRALSAYDNVLNTGIGQIGKD